jgi:PIN domain nuclease of toxin-antitoxin system
LTAKNILVDTQIFLWAITDDPRLSKPYREAYLAAGHELYLSVASVWEMLIKKGIGKLPLPAPAVEYIMNQMRKNRLKPLPIRIPHLKELETLPALHRDPFDRMLVAQARAEGMPILSADPLLKGYNVSIL